MGVGIRTYREKAQRISVVKASWPFCFLKRPLVFVRAFASLLMGAKHTRAYVRVCVVSCSLGCRFAAAAFVPSMLVSGALGRAFFILASLASHHHVCVAISIQSLDGAFAPGYRGTRHPGRGPESAWSMVVMACSRPPQQRRDTFFILFWVLACAVVASEPLVGGGGGFSSGCLRMSRSAAGRTCDAQWRDVFPYHRVLVTMGEGWVMTR